MKWTRSIYGIYGFLVFISLFLVLLPFFLLFIQKKSWHRYALWLNHFWAKAIFTLIFLPVNLEFKQKLKPRESYIFCANHFSWLDIPSMGLIPVPFVFVGKQSIARVPIFGYMYKKLHILVDRQNMRSKYDTLTRSLETLERGLSLVVFPEGGIVSKRPPQMARFKDGAFRAAIAKGIPIVPVTIPYNYIILPDDSFLAQYHQFKMIFHEPIPTSGLTEEDVEALKLKVFNIIDEELKKHHFHEDRPGDIEKNRALGKVENPARGRAIHD